LTDYEGKEISREYEVKYILAFPQNESLSDFLAEEAELNLFIGFGGGHIVRKISLSAEKAWSSSKISKTIVASTDLDQKKRETKEREEEIQRLRRAAEEAKRSAEEAKRRREEEQRERAKRQQTAEVADWAGGQESMLCTGAKAACYEAAMEACRRYLVRRTCRMKNWALRAACAGGLTAICDRQASETCCGLCGYCP